MRPTYFFAACFGVGLLVGALSAHAETVPLTWDATTTRVDGSALAPETITGYQVLLNGLPVPAAQSVLTTGYTYTIPAGSCINTTDRWNVTATDSIGLVSPFSNPVNVSVQVCTPKAKPAAPANVKISIGS